MKLNLTSVTTALAFTLAMTTPVDAKLRGLSSNGGLGLFLGSNKDASQAAITTNDAASSCEPKEIDICIAIDRSGSICAEPDSSTYSCKGKPDCGCPNWDAVGKFANAFIDGISASEAARQFGLVKFATSAGVESSLTNAAAAKDAVVNLKYTSGWTNTTGALELCRDMLKDSTVEKTIVLITDGAPTRPLQPDGPTFNYDYAREQALEQAMTAKEVEDTNIVGVFVNTTSGTSDFLERLTTPGLFIGVTDFDQLEETSATVVDLVQCPPPPPPPTPAPTLPSRECDHQDIDFCIAVDRSGSVCAPPGGPYPNCNGDPNCGDDCPEWNASIEFAKEFVNRADGLPGLQQFALVGFASQAEQESSFTSATEAFNNLDSLAYTGGYTHTGGAIDECRKLLKDSKGEKTIVILTDGIPTRPDPDDEGSPYDYAKEYALERSESAKEEDDITIIGVFIDTGKTTSSYLKKLVTPGYYLEAEFDELDTNMLDSLMSGVECNEPKPSSVPSSTPSITPSAEPSVSPSASPTCLPKDIDVCVAIDRSGSICSSECEKGVPCPTCKNWQDSIDFADAFINRTTTWDGQQRFALVTFGDSGEVHSELVFAEEARTTLRTIPYKREWTNTMDGLQYCRNTLAGSTTDERAIILITDGSPTRPLLNGTEGYGHARKMANDTATMVKVDDGTTLMTVAVATSPYTSGYLEGLASDGFYTKVDNFEELDVVSGRIAALVSCA